MTKMTPRKVTGAPLATGNLQPTAGAVGFTDGYNNATSVGKMVLTASSIMVTAAVISLGEDLPDLLWEVPAGLLAGYVTFIVGSYALDILRGG